MRIKLKFILRIFKIIFIILLFISLLIVPILVYAYNQTNKTENSETSKNNSNYPLICGKGFFYIEIENYLCGLINVETKKQATSTEAIKELIIQYAEEYGVNKILALNIAYCESRYYINASNKTSSAESVFQFLDSTWIETMRRMGRPTTTPKNQLPEAVEAGIFLLKKDGARHWLESRHCWFERNKIDTELALDYK